MSTAFAALQLRAGAAVVQHLANAWAVIVGGAAFPCIFTRQPTLDSGVQLRDITLLAGTSALPAKERGTEVAVYTDDTLTTLLGHYAVKAHTDHHDAGQTLLELEAVIA